MRLQLLTHSYWPEHSPPQRRWTALVARFREAGWEVDVVAPWPPNGAEAGIGAFGNQKGPAGETIRRLPAGKGAETRVGRLLRFAMTGATTVPRSLAAPRPDIIVVTVPSLPNVAAGWLAARLRRRLLIVEMRDAWPDLAMDSGVAHPAVNRAFKMVLTWFQRQADLVVTVTDGFRDLLTQRGITAVSIPNGVVAADLPRVPAHVRGAGPLKVLYLGNHGESQGLDLVVRAAALAGQTAQVRFVGGGTMKPHLERLSARLGADVEFLDSVPPSGVAACYAWADTCVVALRSDWPSFEWTIPSKTYELIATGRHLTAIVRGEAAGILRAAGVGDIVDADPESVARLWRELYEDPERLQQRGNGLDWVRRKADLSLVAEHYMRVAEDLIGQAHGRTDSR
ncbi:glycosyltransferase family 4 protein [Arthrobacter sp. KK5.5]|uniref:glycosyltransferase family 4 protein n=1 Tax=Arthrobacter sp. KK5.5 TaxID=3373084 RepID=UPI003EE49DA4